MSPLPPIASASAIIASTQSDSPVRVEGPVRATNFLTQHALHRGDDAQLDTVHPGTREWASSKKKEEAKKYVLVHLHFPFQTKSRNRLRCDLPVVRSPFHLSYLLAALTGEGEKQMRWFQSAAPAIMAMEGKWRRALRCVHGVHQYPGMA
ncbi:hypothetical protein HYALB_00001016 [Hymenoscyphus albidus]|uniref:Uncharacterized protein n=1 Tax=Hymenoscyphus albidus TaxID=595503 RepID=A0A9N9M125_9HELO|nr:hypothetical protein HYALB_00001016 [Hymenoscyphus albidus]